MKTDKEILRILVSNQFGDFFEDGLTIDTLKRRNCVKQIFVAFLHCSIEMTAGDVIEIARYLFEFNETGTRLFLSGFLSHFGIRDFQTLRSYFLDGPAGTFHASVIARAAGYKID